MAKGNMFLGMARGSVGDVTFYRKSGQQAARVRNRNPRNPKTAAQIIQRMILATASKAYSRLKLITDHSFEGVEYGSASQSYFLKRAMDDIRAFVSANYPTATETDVLNFRGLAEPNVVANAGEGLLISEGTLPTIAPQLVTDDGVTSIIGAGETVPENPTIANVMTALGAEKGDQITLVGFSGSGITYVSRYVINAEATTQQLSAAWDPTGAAAAFDAVKTQVGSLQLVPDTGSMAFTDGLCIAAGAILSRKVGNTWLRSTQRLWPLYDGIATLLVENGPDVVIPIWEAGTAQVDTENPYYLNQAEVGE